MEWPSLWLHEGAHGFAEAALGGEVEGVGGFVEEELAGAVDEGAGDEDAAFFSGGHFADGLVGEVGGCSDRCAFEGFGGAGAHVFGDEEVGPEAGGGEEAGDDGIRGRWCGRWCCRRCRRGAGCRTGGREGVGDDAEVLAELGEVPAGAAEDA